MLAEIAGIILPPPGERVFMPNSIEDLTWLFFSTITVMLMLALCGILWFWGRRVCVKMDTMATSISKLFTAEKVNEARIETHIEDDNVHCKGTGCIMGRSQ